MRQRSMISVRYTFSQNGASGMKLCTSWWNIFSNIQSGRSVFKPINTLGFLKMAGLCNIDEAVRLLQSGQVVGLPTETVYGLGANALDTNAVAKVFEAKNRPSFDPLIVHVADLNGVRSIAELTPEAES